MKLIASAAALALIAVPALAQQAASASPATTPPAAGTVATTAKLTIDSPIEAIAADAAGKAVLDEAIPGITGHPAFDQFKAMSVKQLQPLANGLITDEMVAKITEGLAKIK